jgi:hypothetical protein
MTIYCASPASWSAEGLKDSQLKITSGQRFPHSVRDARMQQPRSESRQTAALSSRGLATGRSRSRSKS